MTLAVSQNTLGGNWGDEWADYMANSDIDDDSNNGDQHVFTYVVEVDPKTGNAGNDNTIFWKSMADAGQGKYFGVSSGNAGQAIINALNQIFQEVQAINSVFASTTLPVSVNVRGTNLNQVYIGVFRPDEKKSPRWFGNLKMYQLGVGSTGALFLADAADNPAENPDSGFINPTSPSFWTTASTFWGFRTADQNGPGGASDSPDGDLVEKGGSAQQQRLAYDNESTTPRKLYTCTTGGTTVCSNGSLLSATPFSTANDGINSAGLQLGVVAVSTLTGFDSKSITMLTDTKTVSGISTAAGIPVTISSLSNGASNHTVSSLITTKTATISSISNGAVTKTITVLARATGSTKLPVTATVTGHGYNNGDIVHISGVSASEYNGTFVISGVTTNTFQYNPATTPTASPNIASAVVAKTTTSATATTSAAHSFSIGDQVVISGVSPSTWNNSGAAYTITNTNSPTNTTFSFSTASQLAPATTGGTATGPSTTATATTSVAHGFPNNSKVRISGATPSGYNGVFTISNSSGTTFQYTVSSNLANATGTITANQGSGTLVTATAPGHGFGVGSTASITIATPDPSEFAGSFPITIVDANTFTYDTSIRLPANLGTGITALSGTSTTATVTASNHGFQALESVIIAGVTGPDATATAAYNGTHTILTVPTANTFTYTVAPDAPAAATTSGTITARLSSGTAFATVTGHGYNTGDVLTIKGASVSEYNRSDIAITKIDNDNFRYATLAVTAKGAATGTITANKKSTTAKVRAVAHGFANGNGVAIAGASPSNPFNGTKTITYVDADNFTYTLGSAQGDATGTITASFGSGSGGELTNLINWVRGADNFADEDQDGASTDPRPSMQGDVLHSRPAVVNYNRFDDSNGGKDNDVYIFYGSNDGVFRAVKGGFESATGEPVPGAEAWGFIPEEFFGNMKRLRNQEPTISSSNKKPYFADGTLGVFVKDVGDDPDAGDVPDGKLDDVGDSNPDNNDKVWLFISMRRGGRFIYALDVTVPTAPKLLWKKQAGVDAGFLELGYTWSAPLVKTLAANSGKPVLIFGAGYDPLVEDLDPATITGLTATQVITTSGTFDRSMGRGIYVVDAETGTILWQAGRTGGADPTGTHPYLAVSGMDYSIPSDVTVIKDRNGAVNNRAYVGDTGGNMWRVDMASADVDDWTVTKLASVQDVSGLSDTPKDPGGLRKFLFPPDVVYSENGYDSVLVGSGDREHPFDTAITNRFYMFKDMGIGTTPDTSGLDESDLFDATSDCVQNAAACTGGDTPSTALEDLSDKDGWYITLDTGEKVVGNAVTLNNVTFFNTNVPTSQAEDNSCDSDLGVARQYKVLFDTAEAFADQNNTGGIDLVDRYTEHPGGGYLPSPVPVVVEIDGKVYEGVISGVAVDKPPGSLLNARLRKFWYKEME
jgi:hypothetical protein